MAIGFYQQRKTVPYLLHMIIFLQEGSLSPSRPLALMDNINISAEQFIGMVSGLNGTFISAYEWMAAAALIIVFHITSRCTWK